MDVLNWVLLPGMGLFLALSVWAYISLRGESQVQGRSGGLGESSAGSETRKQFFTLLLIASGTRLVSLTMDTLAVVISPDPPVDEALVSDDSNSYAWMSTVLSLLPSLFFVSTYSLLILFYAQLCTAVYTTGFPYHKGVYVVCNVVLYLGFILLMCFCTSSSMFWQWTEGTLGCFYFAGLVAVIYYSIQLVFFFRTSHPDDEFFFDMHLHRGLTPRQIVIQRIMWVCVMCCVLFCGLSLYYLGIATSVIPSIDSNFRTPVGMYPYPFEVCLYIATEFLPCTLLLLFTRRNPLQDSPGAQHKLDLEHQHPEASGSNLRPEEGSYQYQVLGNTSPLVLLNGGVAVEPPATLLPSKQ